MKTLTQIKSSPFRNGLIALILSAGFIASFPFVVTAQFDLDFQCEQNVSIDVDMLGTVDSLQATMMVMGDTSLVDSILVELAVKGFPVFWGPATIYTSAGDTVIIPFPGIITNTGSSEQAALYRAWVGPASKITALTPVANALHYDDWQSMTLFEIRQGGECLSGSTSGGDLLIFHFCDSLFFELDSVMGATQDVHVSIPLSEIGDVDTVRTAIISINYVHEGVVTTVCQDTFTGLDNTDGANALLYEKAFSIGGDVDSVMLIFISPDGVFPPFNSCTQFPPFGGDSFIIGTVVVSSSCDGCCAVNAECNMADVQVCTIDSISGIPDELLDSIPTFSGGINLDSLAFVNSGGTYLPSACDTVYIIASDVVSDGGCGLDTGFVTRTFVFFNTSTDFALDSCAQLFIVLDDIPPMISCPADLVLECPANTDTSNTGVATATDNCSTPVVTYTDVITQGACPSAYTISRIWSAADACGNITTCVQTINVDDTTPPGIVCPADLVLECTESTDTSNTGVATGTDNCGAVSISFTDVVTPGGCPFEYTIARTWTAADECGNSVTCVQTISVDDTMPPTLTCPMDATLECTESTDPMDTGFPIVLDNCDTAPIVTYQDAVIPGACPFEYTIIRTWSAEDICNNVATCVQTINVDDTMAPSLTCPADLTIECTESTSPDNTGLPIVADNCDSAPLVTYSDTIAPGLCPQEFVVTRTWTATDICGNSTQCAQVITVDDSTPPVISCPVDLTLECTEDINPPATGVATATDNCSMPAVTYADVITPGLCPQEYTITRTWTATDDCGNTDSCVQTIAVVDDTPPVISCPPDITIECDASFDPANTGTATATDNCSMPVVTYTESISPGMCLGEFVIFRNWTATDACGTLSSCLQTIVVEDSTPPEISCGENMTLECSDPIPVPVINVIDNCDPDPVILPASSLIPGSCAGEFTIFRSWMVTDACGNVSTCTQVLNFIDTTPPEISCPADITVVCDLGFIPDDPQETGFPTVLDNCDQAPSLTYSDELLPGGCAQEYTLSRTWIASDDCGNVISCVQTISVEDTQAPQITTVPADITVECGDVIPVGMVGATDNCSADFVITYVDLICDISTAGFTGDYDFANWTAVEPNGGFVTTMGDSAVLLSGPEGILCEDLATTFSVTVPADGKIVFGWDYETEDGAFFDPFGYSVNGVFAKLTLDSGPDAQNGLGVAVVSAGDVFAFEQRSRDCIIGEGVSTVIDFFVYTCEEADIPGDPCDYTIYRCYNATDECGNTAYALQQIRVVDSTAPSVTCPSDLTIYCDESSDPANTGMPTAADNCDLMPFVTYGDVVSPDPCNGEIIRTWIATDACGLGSSCVQVISVQDISPPNIDCPADLTISPGDSTDPADTGEATATDNCDPAPVITYADVTVPGACPEALDIVRTWTATDVCGNSATCIQTITIADTPLNPVCQGKSVVPLNSEGMAVIAASVFDAGSTGGCGPVYFKARRMDVPQGFDCFLDGNPLYLFDDYVKFCCEDVGDDSLMVILRVYSVEPVPGPVADDYLEGHFADCMLRIIVQDKRPPQIICPSDLTISCEFLFAPDNLSVFGDVVTDPADRDSICLDDIGNPDTDGLTCIGLDGLATDNCTVTMTVDSMITIDSLCGTGVIRRIFTATDPGGLTASCEQVITIINLTPFVEDSIDWPDNYTTYDTCQIDLLDPEDLAPPHNEPVYPDDVCSMLTHTHSDLVFDFSSPLQACFKILRTWTVIDWCQYEPGSGAGIWSQTQIIKVLNTMPPDLTILAQDSIQCSDNPDCGPGNFVLEASATDDCSAPDALNWIVAIDEFNDGSLNQTFLPADGPDVQIPVVLPLGAHRILYSVEDYCGNKTTEEQYLTVVSCKPPSPKCIDLITTFMQVHTDNDGISDWGMAVVWASDFDAGSDHPCDNPFTFSFNEEGTMDSLVFDCDDIGVNDDIQMWVIDTFGNADFCLVTLTIQDNLLACPDDPEPHAIISGTVSTSTDESVPGVEVRLRGSSLPSQTTFSNGNYVFPPMPHGGNYEVSPGLNINHKKGVSTIDLILLQKHLLGIKPLQDPYDIIAADANHSETISAVDIVVLRKLILGVTDTIPNNTSWRFVDAAYAFWDPVNPLAEAFPESYLIGTLENDMPDIDFVAVKVGDLNGSALQGIQGGISTRNAPADLVLSVQDRIMEAGESAIVDIYCHRSMDLATVQFTLSWDHEMFDIEPLPGTGFITEANWSAERLYSGQLPVSWTQYDKRSTQPNKIAISLRVTARMATSLTAAGLSINSEITETEALLASGQLGQPRLEIWPAASTSEHMEVYQNRPNPFDRMTLIPVVLPEATQMRIEVYREDGTRVFEQEMAGRNGYNQIMIDANVLGGAGIYAYRISTDTEYRTLRMIVVGE